MDVQLKQMTDFLRSIGADDVAHTSKTYLSHVIGVYRDLQQWHCDEELCRAGVFHSIYGTELFDGFTLPLSRRFDVVDLIGVRAERLAYWNCAMNRLSFDKAIERGCAPYIVVDRFTGGEFEPTPAEFDDLCTLHLCDWCEQLPRSRSWNYRREAYRMMAERLGGIALENYQRVMYLETDEVPLAAS